jgi:hypothetical protein
LILEHVESILKGLDTWLQISGSLTIQV